jgi:hypothetical protein
METDRIKFVESICKLLPCFKCISKASCFWSKKNFTKFGVKKACDNLVRWGDLKDQMLVATNTKIKEWEKIRDRVWKELASVGEAKKTTRKKK